MDTNVIAMYSYRKTFFVEMVTKPLKKYCTLPSV